MSAAKRYAEQVRLGTVLSLPNLAQFIEEQEAKLEQAEQRERGLREALGWIKRVTAPAFVRHGLSQGHVRKIWAKANEALLAVPEPTEPPLEGESK